MTVGEDIDKQAKEGQRAWEIRNRNLSMAAYTWIVLEGTVLEPCSEPVFRVCLSWWSHAHSHCHVGWRAQQTG